MWSAAILCGGGARRFGGRDKGALLIDGKTILQHQVTMLARLEGVQEILLVGRSSHPAARTISDLVPGSGPLGGIHSALTEARGNAVFVLACDMPYVSDALVSYLIGLSCDADLVVPRTEDRYHPLCAVYTHACLEPVARRLGDRRLRVLGLLEDVRTRVVTDTELDQFGNRHRLLRNVNTPVDYAALQESAGHQL